MFPASPRPDVTAPVSDGLGVQFQAHIAHLEIEYIPVGYPAPPICTMKTFALSLPLLGLATMAIAAPPVTSGLKLQFDSANIDTLGNTTLLDGRTVSTWSDLSGSGLHLDNLRGTPTAHPAGPGLWQACPWWDFNPRISTARTT